MEQDHRSAFKERLTGFSRLAAVAAIAAGVLVWLGWAFDIPILRTFFSGLPGMKANGAAAFIIAGASLWLSTQNGKAAFIAGKASAAIVALIGLLTLGQYVFGMDLGVDQLLITDNADEGPNPGRIPLPGAVNFLCLGMALLLLDIRASASRWPAQWLLLLVIIDAASVILGYSYGLSPFRQLPASAPVALHGGVIFVILALGTFAARPDQGLTRQIVAADASGVLMRRLLPAAIIIPPLIGWLRVQGEEAGLFDRNTGVTLVATTSIIIFVGLIWSTAVDVRRADAERRNAELRAQAQLARVGLLNQIARAIGERQDLSSIFHVVLRSLEEHLNVAFSLIALHDSAADVLMVESVGPRSTKLAGELGTSERARIGIDSNGLSRCVHGTLVYEPDVSQIAFPFAQRLARGGLRSLVISPLLVESSVFGVLVAARREAESFSSHDCEFLRQLSEHVALAAHQAQLYGALQQAYEDLRRSQQTVVQQERLRALGQMASGIAHDINNALSPVALYTESLLERERQLSPAGRSQLGIMQRAMDDVAQTISRMREFYGQRGSQLELVPVDLNRCVRQVIDLTRARWRDLPQQRGVVIDLKTELEESPPAVMGVESEIRDAITNLVFNAVDAMPAGGELTLRTKIVSEDGGTDIQPPSHVCVEVSDTGLGMDEETQRKCLEPFFTTKGERGTGLGLAMVYGMAKRHGAELGIESEVGHGTTIRLTFPAASESAAADKVSTIGPIRRLRILVVDDDPLLIRSLYDTLTGDGHAVTIADGGKAGIQAFNAAEDKGEPFAVVITDLGMPYVDGHKVAAAVRARSRKTKVIMLTGWGQRLLSANELPPNVDRVMAKPPKQRELRAALSEVAAQTVVAD